MRKPGSATGREAVLICFHLAGKQECTPNPGGDTHEESYSKGKLPPAYPCYLKPVPEWLAQTGSWGRASTGSWAQLHTEQESRRHHGVAGKHGNT